MSQNFSSQHEDYSEYYLLLGDKIESLTIKTEIFISCKNLRNAARGNGCFVSIEIFDGEFWTFFGQTELAFYTENPLFQRSFVINYNFKDESEEQRFKFTVKYLDNKNKTIVIGNAQTTLKSIFISKNQIISLPISKKHQEGEIRIKLSQKKNVSEYIRMRIGIKGPRISSNKIFCRISRITNKDNELMTLHVTEEKEQVHRKERAFFWDEFEFPSDRIAKKQLISEIDINIVKFQIFEVEKKHKQKLLTEKDVNIDDLINGSEFNLPKVTDEYNYLILDDIKTINKYSLFAFLISGMQYSPCFFIDCTRSKFNLILSEKRGNKYSENFNKKYQKQSKNNELLIYRPRFDVNSKQNNLYSDLDNYLNINNNIPDSNLNLHNYKNDLKILGLNMEKPNIH